MPNAECVVYIAVAYVLEFLRDIAITLILLWTKICKGILLPVKRMIVLAEVVWVFNRGIGLA